MDRQRTHHTAAERAVVCVRLYEDVTPGATQDFDVTIPVQDLFSPSSPRSGSS